jgi:MFS family permease
MAEASVPSASGAGAVQRPWLTVVLLSLTYLLSMIDRHILVLLVEPIRTDLQISDTQIGLVTGVAFGLAYAIFGLPLGRLADRWSRKRVLILGVVFWSLMTMACGLSTSFVALFVARMGVGLGEAALTPTSHALIATSFPPDRVPVAMSIFQQGAFFGLGASLLLGGALVSAFEGFGEVRLPGFGELKVWQSALLAMGVISLLWVIALLFLVEPPRERCATEAAEGNAPGFVATYLQIIRVPGLGPLILASAFASMWAYGAYSWIPTLLVREHGYSVAQTGLWLGVATVVVGAPSAIAAGWLAQRMYRRFGSDACIRLMLGCLALSMPAYVLGLVLGGATGVFVAFLVINFAGAFVGTLWPVATQALSPDAVRSQVAAAGLFATSLIGATLGSTAVAVITDLVFTGPAGLSASLALNGVMTAGAAIALLVVTLRPR